MTTKTQKQGELAILEHSQLPVNADLLGMMQVDSKAGLGNVNQEDIATPFLKILQALSPQVKKQRPEYIEGAEEGMIYNTVSKQVFDGRKGLRIIPCGYMRRYVEWRPNMGGFAADHGTDSSLYKKCLKNERGVPTTPEGNEIVAYATWYVLVVDDVTGAFEPAVISMTSSQFKVSTTWMASITQLQLPTGDSKGFFNPAIFDRAFRLTTKPESNDQNDWFGWKVEPENFTLLLPNGKVLRDAAKSFCELINQGSYKVAVPDEPVKDDTAVTDAF